MGQQISGQAAMGKLPEKLLKHAGLVRDSSYLTYEEFLAHIAELNEVTAKLAIGQPKHLLFEVQPGSDASALWKVAVRIVCTKFIQLYKDITSQAAEVLAAEGSMECSSGQLFSAGSCQASMWMGRVKQLTDEEECCICMDGKADLILSCAHSFCQKCIDKWSGRNCPICRIQLTAANEPWVMSDAPTEEDIASYILNLADEAGHPHRP
ncbi:RING finger protein 141 isoform X2 [Ictalurus furcatus]|uniref:RING finger protein 141 isoform X2 n=1 Tax=Ictalurus furcatus TaxID=66913 RepID=UPI00234FC7D4|nr:RING finger protein 141 isoform X2 [Ictalurus furcatus]